MNQISTQETVKQGWMTRIVTAVFNKFFSAFTYHETTATPRETQMFLNYSSYGWEEAMMSQYYSWSRYTFKEDM